MTQCADEQTIFRETRRGRYFQASTAGAQDSRLSWRARGLLSYLMSKPKNWAVTFSDLLRQGDVGRDTMQQMLKELEDLHYLSRARSRKAKGQFEYVLKVYGSPDLNLNPQRLTSSPSPELQVAATPAPLTESPAAVDQAAVDQAAVQPVTANQAVYMTESGQKGEGQNREQNREGQNGESSFPLRGAGIGPVARDGGEEEPSVYKWLRAKL